MEQSLEAKQYAYQQYLQRANMLKQAYMRLYSSIGGASYAQLDPQIIAMINNIYEKEIKADAFDSVKLNDSIYNNIQINNI